MKILFLTDNFPPEVNAPANRTFEHCKVWVKEGHDVFIITCAPNFPDGIVFKGYKNSFWSEEWMDGIRVIRVKTFISANRGIFFRVLDYLSFMFSACLAALFIKKIDVVIGTSPQFFTACAAAFVGRVKKVPWIFEVRDLWPESIKVVLNLNDNIIIRMLERLEFYLYGNCHHIVVVTTRFRESLVKRGISPSKISVVPNGVNTKYYNSDNDNNGGVKLPISIDVKDKFVISYIGSIGMAHGLSIVVEAAELLKKDATQKDILFLIVGSGAEREILKNRIENKKLENVLLFSTVPKEHVKSILAASNASLVHLRNKALFQQVIPSKIFEAMAMGLPILLGVDGESREIVVSSGSGIFFEPENAADLLVAIEKLRRDEKAYQKMSSNGKKTAELFEREALAKVMLSDIEAIVKRH